MDACMLLRDNINNPSSHQLAYQSLYITKMEPPRRFRAKRPTQVCQFSAITSLSGGTNVIYPSQLPGEYKGWNLAGHFLHIPPLPFPVHLLQRIVISGHTSALPNPYHRVIKILPTDLLMEIPDFVPVGSSLLHNLTVINNWDTTRETNGKRLRLTTLIYSSYTRKLIAMNRILVGKKWGFWSILQLFLLLLYIDYAPVILVTFPSCLVLQTFLLPHGI